ncbi:hypothetical protein FPOAC2_07352 [Fusarium poae]
MAPRSAAKSAQSGKAARGRAKKASRSRTNVPTSETEETVLNDTAESSTPTNSAKSSKKTPPRKKPPPRTPANENEDDDGSETDDDDDVTITHVTNLKEFGPQAAQLLPEKLFGIAISEIDFRTSVRPQEAKKFTIWAFLRALRGCSVKGLEAVKKDQEPRPLVLRTKKSKEKSEIEYVLNFTSTQNCDAMLRYLFGEEVMDDDGNPKVCEKCLKGNGALIGCIVGNGASSCANCDWNRSGAACSFTSTYEAICFSI